MQQGDLIGGNVSEGNGSEPQASVKGSNGKKTVTIQLKNGHQKEGRTMDRVFTSPGKDPFDLVEWDYRDCVITNDRGDAIFKQKNVEVPKSWSPMAIKVVASKYLYGDASKGERESGVRALISRVVNTIHGWGMKGGYFASDADGLAFKQELTHILLHQYAAFNSPVWFNVGVAEHPQCSACFIVSVDDTMESLLDLQKVEGTLFKFGSGTGSNLSTIRSCREKLTGGGTPSGPVSFMRGFDAWAGIIKSGGKTRRAAKMQILNATHPDIVEFISCKMNEEKKAWALIEQGYDGSFAAQGGAYESVSFQNANLSVRAGDDFMRAVKQKKTFWTNRVKDGQPCEELDADRVMRLIAEGTWICGDPGMQFDTTINDWHTCPNSGRINASNPCSEYMHVDNSACNLSSINLCKFLEEGGTFDVDKFLHVVDVLITAQDILIDNSSYPTRQIEKNARDFRQLGLGYANLGALLMSLGIPYDSDEGREWAAVIAALMTGQAYKTSAKLAKCLGPFAQFNKNKKPMLRVIEKHRDAAIKLVQKACPGVLKERAVQVWSDALNDGTEWGYKNSQATVLAPTGTISFMMDCDTTGIEPDIALVKYKKLSDGGLLKIVNRTVERALVRLGYNGEQIKRIKAYIEENDTIEGSPDIKEDHLPVFDCAFKPAKGHRSIGYMGHLRMMAAAQPFISGAISKTVNLPSTISVEEIYDVYVKAWELGVKAVALYRDGSKRTQPLNSSQDKKKEAVAPTFQPVRRRLPDERHAITHKFNVGGLEGYLTIGLYEDGKPGEIFLVVAKEGSTLSGIMDAFATSVSIALQYGVPLSALVKKFTHLRFEPSGFTPNPDIPMAKSIVDYVFRYLSLKFLSARELSELGLSGSKRVENGEAENKVIPLKTVESKPVEEKHSQPSGHTSQLDLEPLRDEKTLQMSVFKNSEDAPPCTNCGSGMMVRQAGCYVCLNCGAQGGCG